MNPDSAQITFLTREQLDALESDNTPILNTSDNPWESQVRDMERATVLEIRNHPQVQGVTMLGRDHEGTLVVEFDANAMGAMPYEVLYITREGKVAEAMLNQPVYHRTFRELVEDTRSNAR